MKVILGLGILLLLAGCEAQKSSEEKASEMTRQLLKEMHRQDSLEAAGADSLK